MSIFSKRNVALAASVIALGGCVTFKAVTATSQLGEQLAGYRPQVSVIRESCQLLRIFGAGTACPSQVEKYEKALDALVAYSKQLDAAAGEKAPTVSDDLQKALGQTGTAQWTSLPSGTESDIVSFATGVSAFLTREATRASVQKAVRDVGPSLDKVSGLLIEHFLIEQ
jgi:hypothetical protein